MKTYAPYGWAGWVDNWLYSEGYRWQVYTENDEDEWVVLAFKTEQEAQAAIAIIDPDEVDWGISSLQQNEWTYD